MLYYTNKARKSHIDEITRLINVLGNLKSEDLCYIDYRRLVEYLSDFKDLIKAEIDGCTIDEMAASIGGAKTGL